MSQVVTIRSTIRICITENKVKTMRKNIIGIQYLYMYADDAFWRMQEDTI